MAKIRAGILSKVSGKVAGVVGGTWKGTNYLRELVKPANPNTPLQQAQRSKMAFVVRAARQLIGDVLNPYLNKFCKDMSGYNWFCKENIKKSAGTPLAFTSAPEYSFGTLSNGGGAAAPYDDNSRCDTNSLPTVGEGHSLSFIAVAMKNDGTYAKVATKNNVVSATGLAESIVVADEDPNGTYYIGGFFADFDANGVLQALSATVQFGTTTLA